MLATLNVIKGVEIRSLFLSGNLTGDPPHSSGKPMRLELASVTSMQTKKTVWSYLTQAAGLMAELDIGKTIVLRLPDYIMNDLYAHCRHRQPTVDGGDPFHGRIRERR